MLLFFSIYFLYFVDKIQFLQSGDWDFHITNIKFHIKFNLTVFIKLMYSNLCHKYAV